MLQVIDIKCALVKTIALSILRTNGKTDSLVLTEGEFIERLLYARDGKICCVTGMVREIRPIEKPTSKLRSFYNNPMSDNHNGYYITIDASTVGMSNIIRITSMDIRGIVTDPDHQCPPYEDPDEPVDPDMSVDPITPEQLQQILQEAVSSAVKEAVANIDETVKEAVDKAVDDMSNDYYTKVEVDTHIKDTADAITETVYTKDEVDTVVDDITDRITWKDYIDGEEVIPPTEEDGTENPDTPPTDGDIAEPENPEESDTPGEDDIPDTLPDEDGTTITIPVEDLIDPGAGFIDPNNKVDTTASLLVEEVIESKIVEPKKVVTNEPILGIIRRCVTNPR